MTEKTQPAEGLLSPAIEALEKWGTPAGAGEPDAVAYLDIGTGYLDLGTELSEEALLRLPKGRHALVIAGTYGIDGYVAAPQPSPTAQTTKNVPAIQGETNVQLDTDPNTAAPGQQRDVARSVLGQPMGHGPNQVAGHLGAQGDKLLTVAERNLSRFLETAVFRDEADRQAALNCLEVLTTPAPAQPGQEGELPSWWPDFIKGVCEIPDRSSLEGKPEAIIATPEELAACALSAIDSDRAACAAPQPATTDTELLDFIEKHPEKSFRYRKGKWAFLGFTNYEFDMYPSLREAIDAAKREVKPWHQ